MLDQLWGGRTPYIDGAGDISRAQSAVAGRRYFDSGQAVGLILNLEEVKEHTKNKPVFRMFLYTP
jgi:hypothetical protein